MSDLFRDFEKNVHAARSLVRWQRETTSLMIEENARMVAKTRATIDSSRELLTQIDKLWKQPVH